MSLRDGEATSWPKSRQPSPDVIVVGVDISLFMGEIDRATLILSTKQNISFIGHRDLPLKKIFTRLIVKHNYLTITLNTLLYFISSSFQTTTTSFAKSSYQKQQPPKQKIEIAKVVPFKSIEVFRRDPFLVLYFSLVSSVIFLLLCLLSSAVLFMPTTWPLDPPPLGPCCGGGHTRRSNSTKALV